MADDRARRLEARVAELEARNRELEAAAANFVRSERDHQIRDARFEALVLQTSEVLFEVGADGRIASNFGTRHLGFDADDLNGRSALDFLHPDDRERALASFEAYDPAIPSPPIVVRGVGPDGPYRWYEATTTSFLDPDGELRVLVVARDVDEQTRGRIALQDSEERYRAMVDQSPLGVLIIDDQADVVMVNEAFVELVGASSVEELVNLDVCDSFDLEPDAAGAVAARALRGERVTAEISYMTNFGQRVDARIHGAPLDNQGSSPGAAQLLFEDISTSRQLEQQLRQAQKMEAVGRLAGGIVHDFGNQLTVILGCADSIRQTVSPGSPAHEAADQITQAAERSATLTRQLLAFSRQQVIQPEAVDIGTVVAEFEPMLRRLLGGSIQLESAAEGELPEVWLDPALLGQVLVNLVVNARDAMPQGGVIRVEARRSVTTPEPGAVPGVELTVRDTGIGMKEAVAGQVFEPFFTTKPEGHGTGLGLSTAYGIIHQFNGTIEVDSTPGVGSTFTIGLPAMAGDEPVEAAPVAPIAADRSGPERVLLVEDEELLRDLLDQVLRSGGYEVVVAADGRAALDETVDVEPFDLVVTDVKMPRLGGVELAAELRDRQPGIAVLFMSGFRESAMSPGGGLPDGSALVHKPFTTGAFLDEVHRLLEPDRRRNEAG